MGPECVAQQAKKVSDSTMNCGERNAWDADMIGSFRHGDAGLWRIHRDGRWAAHEQREWDQHNRRNSGEGELRSSASPDAR